MKEPDYSIDQPSVASYSPNNEATPMLSTTTIHAFGRSNKRSSFPAIRPGKEVHKLKKPARFRVGIVAVTERQTPKVRKSFWELRYVDPDTGREVRRRVSGVSRDEIRAMADHLTRQAYQGKGYLATLPKAPTIPDALAEAIRFANTRKHTEKGRAWHAKRFVTWLTKKHPRAQTWDQLRPAMLQEYALELEGRGLAYDTVRLAVAPVKMAWRHMLENYPDLVRPLSRIRLRPAALKAIECLDSVEVGALLDWLKNNSRDVWPIATLQGLCGLRMLEASSLREQDVDLEASTLTVASTEYHVPKTRSSYRTIPICSEVADALRVTMSEQRIRVATGEIFLNRRGNLWNSAALTSRMIKTLRQASESLEMHRIGEIPCRKLRAAFATMAGRLRVPDRLLKTYMGQSSGDILGGHYMRIGIDELRLVSDRIGERKSLFEALNRDRKHSGNIRHTEYVTG